MLSIEVRNKRYNCDLVLKHKISVIKGDSGTGKTWLTKALVDISGGYKVTYSQIVIPVLLNEREWEHQLIGDYKDTPLFIVDDCDFVFTKEFGNIFNTIGICYLILIIRTSVRIDKLERMNTISVSGDAIYNFVANGIEHTINTDIDFKTIQVDKEVHCNRILCEDSGSGFTFFKHLYGNDNVVSSFGKDNIVKHIISKYEEYSKLDSLLLIVDYSAIGLRLREILGILKFCNINVYMIVKYKSFEYMLLRSNMFNISEEDICRDELSYPSLEVACESLLTKITKDKIYTYDKRKELKPCYYLDCCMMNRRELQCDRELSGDKIESLLKDTEFDILLKVKVV